MRYSVDLAIWAHEHDWERLWPIYDWKVLNGSGDPYVDPKAPVHIITGSAVSAYLKVVFLSFVAFTDSFSHSIAHLESEQTGKVPLWPWSSLYKRESLASHITSTFNKKLGYFERQSF